MGSKFAKQFKNDNKNTDIKCLADDKVFVVSYSGHVKVFSIIKNKIVNDLGKILNDCISSMTKTLDNKS